MVEGVTLLLLVVLALAVIFDYINGFHDTANAIATSVSTRALKPEHAILLSATANFAGALMGTAVAKTIGAGLVDSTDDEPGRRRGRAAGRDRLEPPHVAARDPELQQPRPHRRAHRGDHRGGRLAGGPVDGVFWKVLVPLVLSPILGITLGFLFMVVLLNVFRGAGPQRLNERFRRLQVVSAGYMAFAHGSNDAQKTMGIMTLALLSAGVIDEFEVPLPVILVAATAISLGTAAGGWRIIKTMGQRVVRLDPVHGFAAETTGATIILGASFFGAPVSTTHVISTAIMGVGSSQRVSAVHWGVAGDIVAAWVLTLPASALVAGLAYLLLDLVL